MAKTYTLTGKGLNEAKTKGQQALIVEDLRANPGSTIEQIAARIKANLTTRQDPARVVAFYMSTYKKKGLVIVTGESGTDAPPPTEVQTIVDDPIETSETPVSTEAFSGETPTTDIAQDEAAKPKTVSESILEFAAKRGENGFWPDDVVAELNGAVTKKQVNDALRRLVQKSEMVRADSGEFYHPNFVPTTSASE